MVYLKPGSSVLPFFRSSVLPFFRSSVLPFFRSSVLNKVLSCRRHFSIFALFALVSLGFSACESPVTPEPEQVVTVKEIPGVKAPAAGETPVTAITPTAQYTGTVTWTPIDAAFVSEKTYTATITLAAKEGYTFTGVGADFFTVAGADTVTNSADSGVVSAVFPADVFYTVRFNSNEGSAIPSQDVAENGKVTRPEDPIKADYTFAAWYTDAALTTPWNFDVNIVTGNTTLYAKYTAGTYLTGTDEIGAYLADKTGTIDAPALLAMKINISSEAVWNTLLAEIQSAGKYVNLDLAECPIDGTEFGFPAQNTVTGGKDWIVSIVLPNTAASIRDGTNENNEFSGAFMNYSALKSFSGSGLTEIGVYAFCGCTNLTSLPKGITEIGLGAFALCTNLALTTLPEGITEIGIGAFANCTNLALISLPEGIIKIGEDAFKRCASLALTALPNGITEIGREAFAGCTNLALTALPDDIIKIGRGAFVECTNLALTSLPEGITEIGAGAFAICTNIVEIRCLSLEPPTAGSDIFSGCSNLTAIKVASSSIPAYKTAPGWKEYADLIEEL